MRRWLSCELTHDEWAKVRTFVQKNGIKYEASGVGALVHAEDVRGRDGDTVS